MRRACDSHSLGNTKGKKLKVNRDLEASDDEAEEVEDTTISLASLLRDIHDFRLMVDKEDRLIRKIAAHQRKVFAYQRKHHIFMFQYLGLKLPPELVLRDDDDLVSDITSDEAEEEVIEQGNSNDSTISLESCSQCIHDLDLKMDRIIGKRRKLEADWRKSLAYMREMYSIIYQRLGFKPPPEPMESDVDSD